MFQQVYCGETPIPFVTCEYCSLLWIYTVHTVFTWYHPCQFLHDTCTISASITSGVFQPGFENLGCCEKSLTHSAHIPLPPCISMYIASHFAATSLPVIPPILHCLCTAHVQTHFILCPLAMVRNNHIPEHYSQLTNGPSYILM